MKQGELEAEFVESFCLYGDAIYRFLLIKVSNKELAEDLTQETFTRYWQSLRGENEMTNVRSFLYTIAHNLAKDWYKRKKSDSLDQKMDTGLEIADNSSLDPETVASHQELLRAIHQLEEDDRTVLLLRFVEGLEPKEIAETLGETPNVISVRIHRATKRLGSILSPHSHYG